MGQPVIGPQVAVLLVRFVASRGVLDLYLVRPVNAGKIIEQRFVIVCFNTEDKISTGIDNPLAHRLFGIEVIAQINRPQRCVAPGVFSRTTDRRPWARSLVFCHRPAAT